MRDSRLELNNALNSAALLNAVIAALLAFTLSYFVLIGRHSGSDRPILISEPLTKVRPVLSPREIQEAHHRLLFSETTLEDIVSGETARFRAFVTVDDLGNRRLPQSFYNGVYFGVCYGNPHNVEYTSSNGIPDAETLLNDLKSMAIPPTSILNRRTAMNDSSWFETGYAAYFAFNELKLNNSESYNKSAPTVQSVQNMIVQIARKHRQISISVWRPHAFGKSLDHDPFENVVIIQEIIPTRTGLNGISSHVTVWSSS